MGFVWKTPDELHSPLADNKGKDKTCTWEAWSRWWPRVQNCPGCGWRRSAWDHNTVDSGSRSPRQRRRRSGPGSCALRTCCWFQTHLALHGSTRRHYCSGYSPVGRFSHHSKCSSPSTSSSFCWMRSWSTWKTDSRFWKDTRKWFSQNVSVE